MQDVPGYLRLCLRFQNVRRKSLRKRKRLRRKSDGLWIVSLVEAAVEVVAVLIAFLVTEREGRSKMASLYDEQRYLCARVKETQDRVEFLDGQTKPSDGQAEIDLVLLKNQQIIMTTLHAMIEHELKK